MRTVWKYWIPPLPESRIKFDVELPVGAKVLVASDQLNEPKMWAEVAPHQPLETRTFLVIGTGEYVPDGFEHVDSWQSVGGVFVWHLYELKS